MKALDNISKCRWLLPPDDPNYRPQTKPKPAALHAVESVSVAAKAAPAAPQASKPAAASSAASALPAPAVAPPPKDPLLVVPSSTQPAPPRQQPASVYAELIGKRHSVALHPSHEPPLLSRLRDRSPQRAPPRGSRAAASEGVDAVGGGRAGHAHRHSAAIRQAHELGAHRSPRPHWRAI